jgi:putative cardiolipin synthase
LLDRLDEILKDLIWAPGQIVWEDPASIYEGTQSGQMSELLYQRTERLDSELLIESAYFVPGMRGIEAAKALTSRGVRVRALTNSLAANDVLAAHAGYAKYRRPLIEAGVELYELRPFPGPVDKKIISAEAKSGLHTKAIVFDRKDVFIGSFNLDPRSASINTEAGLYVESPELASQVMAYMTDGVSAHNAYRVLMSGSGSLHWRVEAEGTRRDYGKDPESRWFQRWLAAMIAVLPVEHQL